MTAKQLAHEVVALLDEQQRYFKDKDFNQLLRCKAMEKSLRKVCAAVIAEKPDHPTLFPDDAA
jgi:hypothetical protein